MPWQRPPIASFCARAAARLDEVTGLSRPRLAELCAAGRVRVLLAGQTVGRAVLNGRPRLPEGARVLVLDEAEEPALLPEEIPLLVLHRDEHCLVIGKPAGMSICPGRGHPAGTLANALRGLGVPLSQVAGPLRPGIVHRLDLGTSGALAVACTDAAHGALAAQFAARTARRTYLALLLGDPSWDETLVEGHLSRRRAGRKSVALGAQGRWSRTRFVVRARHGDVTLCEVRPETGRKHQIRVHARHLGHPLVGDTLYGGPPARRAARGLGLYRPALHALRLALHHPATGAALTVTCPLPDDLLRSGRFPPA